MIWKFHVLTSHSVCHYYGFKCKLLPKPQLLKAAEPWNEWQRVADDIINTRLPRKFIQPMLWCHKWHQQYLICDILVDYSRSTQKIGSRHCPCYTLVPVWRRYLPLIMEKKYWRHNVWDDDLRYSNLNAIHLFEKRTFISIFGVGLGIIFAGALT